MQKFGRTKDQVMAMAQSMKHNFDAVGLPFVFTEEGLTGNTYNGHRLIAWAGSKGPAVQDVVVEELFKNYFAESKFPNDRAVLIQAAVKAGMDKEQATQFVDDESAFSKEVDAELRQANQLRVSGVPYFILESNGRRLALSGAQPEGVFCDAIEQLTE